MKKYYLIILLFFAILPLAAQTDAISYQAVILNPYFQELPGVNAVGNILSNTKIKIRFTILDKNSSEIYQETQSTTTDAYGMINLFIGNGTQVSSKKFNEIDWNGTTKKLKIEIDFSGGNSFVLLGSQNLTFTPYAYHRNITATGTISVDGKANFKSDFNVEGKTVLNDTLTVNGATNFESDLTMKKLVVSGDGGVQGNHVALFENTGGGKAKGIAIKIDNATLSQDNNFITFYGKGDYIAGRIESYDLLGGDLFKNFPIPNFSNFFNIVDFNNLLKGGSLPYLHGGSLPYLHGGSLPYIDSKLKFHSGSFPSLNAGSFPILNVGSFPTVDFTNFFRPTPLIGAYSDISKMVAWGALHGNPGFLPTSPWKIALTPVILAAKQVAMNQGIIYGSKGADYAEWLEKENPNEKYVFGEVVGVKGGKISKVTEGADQVMSISLAPIVLGNMPDKNKQAAYEKVGFLGQVPVLTVGKVTIGDYIVASGFNDGYARAISKKDIQISDIKNIIGSAWSSSKDQNISLINVSVGLNTTDWVEIVKKQQNQLDNLELKIKKLENVVNKLTTM